jgi:cytochrome c556
MRQTMFSVLVIAGTASIAMAGTGADAIKERREIMKANGEATKPLVPMLKGEALFDLATVQKALQTYDIAAKKMPPLFPSESKTGDTHALPVIWENDNMAEVNARFMKLGTEAEAAFTSIKDAATFRAIMPDVFKNCSGCHDKFREKQ